MGEVIAGGIFALICISMSVLIVGTIIIYIKGITNKFKKK
jgi:hypothetical protein